MKHFRNFLWSFIILALLWYISSKIVERFRQNEPMLHIIKNKLKPVFPDIDRVVLLEGEKSYTINKEKIYICLKDKDGNYYNENMLIYVTLHELAHVRCDEIDHTEKWERIFNEILDKATAHGLYNPSIPIIKDYCEY